MILTNRNIEGLGVWGCGVYTIYGLVNACLSTGLHSPLIEVSTIGVGVGSAFGRFSVCVSWFLHSTKKSVSPIQSTLTTPCGPNPLRPSVRSKVSPPRSPLGWLKGGGRAPVPASTTPIAPRTGAFPEASSWGAAALLASYEARRPALWQFQTPGGTSQTA